MSNHICICGLRLPGNLPAKMILALCLTIILFGLGVGARRAVLDAQLELHGSDLPFTMESALEFRYVRMLFNGLQLPRIDTKLQAPDGVNVRATYTIAAEYVYALAAHLFPENVSLTARTRWVSIIWFCLGIPCLFFWLLLWWRSWWGAFLGAAYYAVGLAAVMRSTGQELSHENFALPLLLAHLALSQWAARLHPVWQRRLIGGLSAGLLALALCSWDLIQYYVFLWVAVNYVRMWGGRYFTNRSRAELFALTLLALLIASIWNPYLNAHGFWRAPVMLVGVAALPGVWLQATGRLPAQSRALIWTVRLLPLWLGGMSLILAGTYGSAYNHFAELLWAKVRYLNKKPDNPALLTFAQRILWVPALNSVNFSLTKILFPAIMPQIFWAIGLILFFLAQRRSDPEATHLLFYFIVTVTLFWLFMRFHVFLALFVAALFGRLGAWCATRSGWLRLTLLALMLATVTAEAVHTVHGAKYWGATPAYWRQQRELTDWMRSNATADTVLANYGLSAWLLADGEFPVVLHPKFETRAIRERVQTYGALLFKGSEQSLRDWADDYGVHYLVYALGEFAETQVERQMRYFVNALEPAANAPARIFEYQPEQGRYFKFLWGNSKYRIFRMITKTDEARACRIALEAETAWRNGDLLTAEALAQNALLYDLHNTNAAQLLLRLAP